MFLRRRLRGFATNYKWFCDKLRGFATNYVVLRQTTWFCDKLRGFAMNFVVLRRTTWFLRRTTWLCRHQNYNKSMPYLNLGFMQTRLNHRWVLGHTVRTIFKKISLVEKYDKSFHEFFVKTALAEGNFNLFCLSINMDCKFSKNVRNLQEDGSLFKVDSTLLTKSSVFCYENVN